MADTSHAQAHAQTPPTEGDGVSYSGIFWFVVILTGTTLVCQLLMWGMFVLLDAHRQPTDAGVQIVVAFLAPVATPRERRIHLDDENRDRRGAPSSFSARMWLPYHQIGLGL